MDDYHRDLLFLLNDMGRLLRVEADRRARAHGMTRAQWVDPDLARPPARPVPERTGRSAEVEPITVARLVDRLEARGLVERRADPADRRIWRLHLLPAAGPILAEIASAARRSPSTDHERPRPGTARETLITSLLHMKAALAAERRGRRRKLPEMSQAATIHCPRRCRRRAERCRPPPAGGAGSAPLLMLGGIGRGRRRRGLLLAERRLVARATTPT